MSSKQQVGKRRKGEAGAPPERRSRTFYRGDGWYFMTREHIDVGPFATQELAEAGVQDYAGFSQDLDRLHAQPAEIIPDEAIYDDLADDVESEA